MLKKSAIVLFLATLSSFSFASEGIEAEHFKTINIVRVKLWYDGIQTDNVYNQALKRGMQKQVELPEEIEIALDKLES